MKFTILTLIGLGAVALAAPAEPQHAGLTNAASSLGENAEDFDVEIKAKKSKKHHKKGKIFRTVSNDILSDIESFERRALEESPAAFEAEEVDVNINAKKGKKHHRKSKKHARIVDSELVQAIEKREEAPEFTSEVEAADVNINAKKSKKHHRKSKKHARIVDSELVQTIEKREEAPEFTSDVGDADVNIDAKKGRKRHRKGKKHARVAADLLEVEQ